MFEQFENDFTENSGALAAVPVAVFSRSSRDASSSRHLGVPGFMQYIMVHAACPSAQTEHVLQPSLYDLHCPRFTPPTTTSAAETVEIVAARAKPKAQWKMERFINKKVRDKRINFRRVGRGVKNFGKSLESGAYVPTSSERENVTDGKT
jgi:hypothetical protein